VKAETNKSLFLVENSFSKLFPVHCHGLSFSMSPEAGVAFTTFWHFYIHQKKKTSLCTSFICN